MDYERARFNMVEQQIRPWDVLDQDVLDLLMATRREDFVSPAYRGLAFSDLEVPIAIAGKPSGETMLSPKVEGRILQALALKRHESVLLIGAGSGYLAALMSYRARKITAIEIHPEIAKLAQANIKNAGIHNVLVHQGQGLELLGGFSKLTQKGQSAALSSDIHPSADNLDADDSGPVARNVERYDAIVLSGGLSHLPEQLIACLNPGARVFAFLGEFPVVRAKLLRAANSVRVTGLSEETLFETAIKPLQGFRKTSHFTF